MFLSQVRSHGEGEMSQRAAGHPAEHDPRLDAFIEQNYNRFVRELHFLGVERNTALEVTQTTMVDIVRNWARISTVEYPVAYAQKILLRNAARRRRLEQKSRTSNLNERTSQTSHEPIEESTISLTLRSSLAKLPRGQREVIVLRYYLEFSEREIAASLKCSIGTVKSRSARALKHLRSDLSDNSEIQQGA
jgi:RNA polymerase sigma factor (sigma-70 family)